MASARHDPSDRDPMDVVRAARALLADKKRGRHFDLGFESFTEYAASLGHGAAQARDLLDLARVLSVLPELEDALEDELATVEAVRSLSAVVRDPAVLRLPPGAEQPLTVPQGETRWVEAALALSTDALQAEVSRAVERVRVWPEPLTPLRLDLTPDQRAEMERACRLASEFYERPISPSELIEIAAKAYLQAHDRE